VAYIFLKHKPGETVSSEKHGPGKVCAVMVTDKGIQYAVFLFWKGKTQTLQEDEIGIYLKPGPPLKEFGEQVQKIGVTGENEVFVVNNYEPTRQKELKSAA
jgi:hypothetical protein